MNAELPYLKRIATALGKLPGLGTAGSTSGGTASGNVSVNAAIDAPGIAEALDEALMTTENDAAVSAVKALADGVLAVLEDALFTGTGNDRVSLLAQIHEALPDVGYFEEDGDGNVKLKEQYGGLWTNGFLTAGGLVFVDGLLEFREIVETLLGALCTEHLLIAAPVEEIREQFLERMRQRGYHEVQPTNPEQTQAPAPFIPQM